jgi:predicted transcriptional regulator
MPKRRERRDETVRKRANGALESEVLAVLWAAERPLTPAEVQQALNEDRATELAYTTVATLLTRLLAKGQVEREPAGRAHIYAPTRDAAQFAAERMRDVLADGIAAGADQASVLQHFLAGLDTRDPRLGALLADENPSTPRRRR